MQGTGLEATIQKEPTLLSDADSAAVIAYLQLFRYDASGDVSHAKGFHASHQPHSHTYRGLAVLRVSIAGCMGSATRSVMSKLP